MRIVLPVLAVVLLGFSAQGGDVATEGRTKTIAPYVDDQTYLVVHIDVTRVDLDVVAKYLEALGVENLNQAKDMAAAVKTKFLKSGGKDFYVLMNWAHPIEEYLVVMPMAKERGRQFMTAIELMAGSHENVAFFVGDDALLAGPKQRLARLQDFQKKALPDVTKAFAAVGDGAVQVVFLPPAPLTRAMFEMFPELPKEIGGKTSGLNFQWAAARVDAGEALTAKIVVQAPNAKAAEEMGDVLERALSFAEKSAEVKRFLPDFAKMVPLLTPKVQGDRLALTLNDKDLSAVLLPLIAKQREAARRMTSVNNLKQIGLAMHGFHDVYKAFPPASTYDAKGQPLLSWRVYLLPFVEESPLFQEFRLNEPWDSAHNKKLIARMPQVYRSPALKNVEKGKTTYLVPVGPNTIFGGKKGMPIQKITDGTSNTIMVLEADDSRAVFWTQPEDYKIDAKNPLAGLVRPGTGGFNAAFADGSVQCMADTLDAATLRGMYTASGGEILKMR
jgi:prepilin-type processing-associated H-X9-DG protein